MLVDVLHAWRGLRSRPGFSLTTLIVLAAGIGLVTAIFALADPFLFRSLPYAKPDQLAVITVRRNTTAEPRWWYSPSTARRMPTLDEWRGRTDLFQNLAGFSSHAPLRLRTAGGALSLETIEITDGFMDVLGLSTTADDIAPREGPLLQVLVTASASARIFGSGTESLGRIVPRQDGGAIHVVAVLPESFVFPSNRVMARPEALVLADSRRQMERAEQSSDGSSTVISPLTIVARLRAGVPISAVADALATAYEAPKGVRIEALPLSDVMTRGRWSLALGTFVAGVLILLVCLGNVANLLLVRGAYRRRDFATRESLGASRRDLARLVLLELGFIVVGAVLTGLFLAGGALSAATQLMPLEYLTLGRPSITGRSVAFAAVVGIVVMLAEIVPSFLTCRSGTVGSLANRAVGSEGRSFRVLRISMAASQSALAMILVIGAAFLARSYVNLVAQDTGLEGRAVIATISYPDEDVGARLQRDIDTTLEQLRRIPRVQEVAATTGPMVNRRLLFSSIFVRGQSMSVMLKPVTPGYFDAVGSRITAGRAFAAGERDGIVVNETLARRCWPDRPAIGEAVSYRSALHVVGVVRDAFDFALDRPPQPTVYALLDDPRGCLGSCNDVSYVLRTKLSPSDLTTVVRRTTTRVNSDSVLVEVNTLQERFADSIKNRSFALLVLGMFAVTGALVCSTGLAAMVAFLVRRRRHEIAVCMALGARPRDVLRLVCSEALLATACGVVIGLITGQWASWTLERLLYGVAAGDWSTIAVAVGVMLTTALIAAAVPSLRALRLSATEALRAE